MRLSRSTYVLAAGFVATIPLVFAQCGGDDASTPGGADASSADGTSGDSTTGPDAPRDTSPGTDSAHDAPNDSSNDTSDTSTADVVDAGTDADDASDASDAADAMDAADSWDGFDGYTPGPPCDASAQCGTGECCFGNCANLATDPHNCGSCGNACVTDQFCTGTACAGVLFSNLCANPAGTVMRDEYAGDNDAGSMMGIALAAYCNPAVTVTEVSQDAGIANDPITGRPIAGPGDTLLIGGGSYGQITMGYLDTNALSKIYLATDGPNNLAFFVRSTNVKVITDTYADLNASHDIFVLQLIVEPISGTLSYTGYGMFVWGTAAAGYYFSNVVMPSIASYTDAWYVYEWTDSGDVDGGAAQLPDSTDTFSFVMSGQ